MGASELVSHFGSFGSNFVDIVLSILDFLEQESSGENTGGSTIEDGPKNRSLVEIYADTLEEELDPDELVLLAVEELQPTVRQQLRRCGRRPCKRSLKLLRTTRCGH